MADSSRLPGLRSWPNMPPEWWRFFRELSVVADTGAGDSAAAPNVSGSMSVQSIGALSSGFVGLQLVNDVDAPGNTYFYGTGDGGAKGWYPFASGMAAGANVTLIVRDDGVTEIQADSPFPLVTGEVPPVLVYLDDGSLVYVSGAGFATTDGVYTPPLDPVDPPTPAPVPVPFVLNNANFEAGATGWAGLAGNSGTFTIINDPGEAYQGMWCGEFVGDLADADNQYIFNTLRPIQEASGTAFIRVRFAPLISELLVAVEVRMCVQVVDASDQVIRESVGLGFTTASVFNGLKYQWMPADLSALVTQGANETVRVGVRVRSIYASNGGASVGPYTLYLDAAGFVYG